MPQSDQPILYANTKLKFNEELVINAITHNGIALKYLSPLSEEDMYEICLEAIRNSPKIDDSIKKLTQKKNKLIYRFNITKSYTNMF